MSTTDSLIYKSRSNNTSSTDHNQESDQVGTRLKDALKHGIDKNIRKITMKEAVSLIDFDDKVGEGCFGICNKAKYTIRGKIEEAVAKNCTFRSEKELSCLMFEINTVGSLKHRHIARLYCYAMEEHQHNKDRGDIVLIMEDWTWL